MGNHILLTQCYQILDNSKITRLEIFGEKNQNIKENQKTTKGILTPFQKQFMIICASRAAMQKREYAQKFDNAH